ncbi:MAG TPA: BrnT family toxin [Candidatus Wirthbacteria bacterium]|nr:BrnT family toxin [Candidatus Wirthbacteria bacterium]
MTEFQWDTGNSNKNLLKHQITDSECEEVFFDPAKKQYKDPIHSQTEPRFILIGKTQLGKLLFIAYTIRQSQIRVISARPLNKKERSLYEKTN